MVTIHAISGRTITLGREGENFARQVVFDVSEWRASYGDGTVSLIAQRSGDDEPYPCTVTVDGSAVTWLVTAADTARQGYGKCELRYAVGDVLVKSETWRTYTADALGTPTPEPPEPQKAWVDKVLEAGQAAVDASVNSPKIGSNGNWFVWDFEAGKYVDTGVAASGGGSGDVYSVNGKTGAVELTAADVGAATQESVEQLEVEVSAKITAPSTAVVGQTIVVKEVDEDGRPTEWEVRDSMPATGVEDSGKILTVKEAGVPGWVSRGHWETVLDTVWEQDVISPTAFDHETGIFTCADGELDHLELGTEYMFFEQCVVEGAAYNTLLKNGYTGVTKLSDTTFSISETPPETFVPTNVKFSKAACLAVTNIDARKIRLTLDGQFFPTATQYNRPFYGAGDTYYGMNIGYLKVIGAYHAYQQVTAEMESPFRIVGKILCGFNAPSNHASLHFKNNSFCCPLIPKEVSNKNELLYFLTSDGTKIANLYSTSVPWFLGSTYEKTAIENDLLRIASGTNVKLERWVE